MDRRQYLAGVGALALGGASGCLAAGSGADYDVGMTAEAFDPVELTVATGERVRWRNTSARAHTVTAYGDLLPSGAAYFASGGFETEAAAREAFWDDMGGALETEATYERAFEQPGTYDYLCVPHEKAGMVGRVVVE